MQAPPQESVLPQAHWPLPPLVTLAVRWRLGHRRRWSGAAGAWAIAGVGPRGRWRLGAGAMADACDQAIPPPWHRRNVSGTLRVIPQHPPQRRNRLINRVLRNHHATPHLCEQLIRRDNLTRTRRKARQQPHDPRVHPHDLPVTRNLAGRRINAPFTNVEFRLFQGHFRTFRHSQRHCRASSLTEVT